MHQVLVGKLTLPQTSGQLSHFSLPEAFTWLEIFSAEEISEFFGELLSALEEGRTRGDWAQVTEVLASWHATAEVRADPELNQQVEASFRDFAEGETVSWKTLKGELGL